MATKTELMIKGFKQRIIELVADYEEKLITFRVDATMELEKLKEENRVLKENYEALESEIQMYRNIETEGTNESI